MKNYQFITLLMLGAAALGTTPPVKAIKVDPTCVSATSRAGGIIDRTSKEFLESVNSVAKVALQKDSDGTAAKKKLQGLLDLDDTNFTYFFSLYQAKKNPKTKDKLRLYDATEPLPQGTVVYPTATAPQDALLHLPHTHYRDIQKEEYREAAKQVALWRKAMQAGSGSSVVRDSHIAKHRNIPLSEVELGAKGTDLYIEVPNPRNPSEKVSISFAEAQIIQAIMDVKHGDFGSILFHDIVSSETEDSIKALWKKKSLLDPTKTYEELFRDTKNTDHTAGTKQAYVPTLDADGNISFNRVAPAGHALFGNEAIRVAYVDAMRPDVGGKKLVSVIGNGEDLSASIDPYIAGWMVKNKIPLSMITTEKTVNDLKGGQIAVARVTKPDGTATHYATIVEAAQAKEANQTALFEKLGIEIKNGDQIAFFNTNMSVYNYEALSPKIKKLVAEMGEEEFLQAIAPDLIENWKEQKDVDEVMRKYLQLEGAKGSTLLNLDKLHRERYNEPLIHFLNIGKEDRTNFFSPIKSAFDFFLQFHSDHFAFDTERMRPKNQRPGKLPQATLKDPTTKDKYYADVETVVKTTFEGTSTIDLKSINVDGQVQLRNVVLKGDVSVVNKSGKLIDATAVLLKSGKLKQDGSGRPVLENMRVEIDEQGGLKVAPF